MNVKRFLLVVLAFASLALKPLAVQASPARRPETFPDKVEDGAEALIEATVQIRIAPSGKGDEAQIGLGTLVASGDQTFILTHNHWSTTGRLILPICVLALSACSASIQVPPQAAIYKSQPVSVTVRAHTEEVLYPPQAAIYKGRPVAVKNSSGAASIPAPAWVAIIKSRQ